MLAFVKLAVAGGALSVALVSAYAAPSGETVAAPQAQVADEFTSRCERASWPNIPHECISGSRPARQISMVRDVELSPVQPKAVVRF